MLNTPGGKQSGSALVLGAIANLMQPVVQLRSGRESRGARDRCKDEGGDDPDPHGGECAMP